MITQNTILKNTFSEQNLFKEVLCVKDSKITYQVVDGEERINVWEIRKYDKDYQKALSIVNKMRSNEIMYFTGFHEEMIKNKVKTNSLIKEVYNESELVSI